MSISIFKEVPKRRFFLYLLLYFLLLGGTSFWIFNSAERKILNNQLDSLKQQKENLVQIAAVNTGYDLSQAIGILFFIYDQNNLELESGEFEQVSQEWINIAQDFQILDQIRFINMDGDEIIRVNYADGVAKIVDKEDLQNKKERPYFSETIKLPVENIYISRLDLNIENGVVETPYKPMIRLSMPIFGKDKNMDGIIVLNYLAENMIGEITRLSDSNADVIYLLNQEGYWLSSDIAEDEWGFMFDEMKDIRFDVLFPEEWQKIKNGESGFVSKNGLFNISTPIIRNQLLNRPLCVGTSQIHFAEGEWLIVSMIKSGENNSGLFDQRFISNIKRNPSLAWQLAFSMLLLSIIFSFLVTYRQAMLKVFKDYSERDALTNVYNRRFGLDKIEKIFSLDNRRKSIASICYTDINGLKEVNDTLGHKCGDVLIQGFIKTVLDTIREDDFVIRLGGDEVAIVLKNADKAAAEMVWSRITAKLDIINQADGRKFIISGSHGIVSTDEKLPAGIDEILALADSRMYEEKRLIKQKLKSVLL